MTANHYLVEVDVVFADDTAADRVEESLDVLADLVADLADGIDGDVSADVSRKTVTIHLSLDDDSDESAFARALGAARTVLHAAGAPTPGWDRITLQPVTADLAVC